MRVDVGDASAEVATGGCGNQVSRDLQQRQGKQVDEHARGHVLRCVGNPGVNDAEQSAAIDNKVFRLPQNINDE